jgi:hypothetical protein
MGMAPQQKKQRLEQRPYVVDMCSKLRDCMACFKAIARSHREISSGLIKVCDEFRAEFTAEETMTILMSVDSSPLWKEFKSLMTTHILENFGVSLVRPPKVTSIQKRIDWAAKGTVKVSVDRVFGSSSSSSSSSSSTSNSAARRAQQLKREQQQHALLQQRRQNESVPTSFNETADDQEYYQQGKIKYHEWVKQFHAANSNAGIVLPSVNLDGAVSAARNSGLDVGGGGGGGGGGGYFAVAGVDGVDDNEYDGACGTCFSNATDLADSPPMDELPKTSFATGVYVRKRKRSL